MLIKKWKNSIMFSTVLIPTVVLLSCNSQISKTKVENFSSGETVNFYNNLSKIDMSTSLPNKHEYLFGSLSDANNSNNLKFSLTHNDQTDNKLFFINPINNSIGITADNLQKVFDDDAKTVYKIELQIENDKEFIIKIFDIIKDNESALFPVSIIENNVNATPLSNLINISEKFDVTFDTNVETKGGLINNNQNPNRVSESGLYDNNPETFYRTSEIPATISFTAKSTLGEYISILELNWMVVSGAFISSQDYFEIVYTTSSGEKITYPADIFKDSRIDTKKNGGLETAFTKMTNYISLNQIIKKIELKIISKDLYQNNFYIQDIVAYKNPIRNFKQVPGELLSDNNFTNRDATILESGDKISFNFDAPVELNQISLIRAAYGVRGDLGTNPAVRWAVNQNIRIQYKWSITYEDGEKVGYDIFGDNLHREIFNLPIRLNSNNLAKKVVKAEILAKSSIELKEIIFT